MLSSLLSAAPIALSAAEPCPPLLSPTLPGYMERARLFSETDLYQGAADQLQRIATENLTLSDSDVQEFLYMLGNAYANTDDPRCQPLLERFLKLYPASVNAPRASADLGDFYFFARNYSEALTHYNATDLDALPAMRQPDVRYRKAYAMAKCGFFKEAAGDFSRLATADKDYRLPALFGKAYCEYMLGDYDEAYEDFLLVKGGGTRLSGSIESGVTRRHGSLARRRGEYTPTGLEADYYLAQIEYLRGRYDEAVALGENALLKTPVDELIPQTLRVIGLGYYKLGDYHNAEQPLTDYVEKAGESAESDAVYALATILYDDRRYEEAAPLFSRLTELHNAQAQGAYLALGQIASLDGDDNAAAISFGKAARMPFDREVTRKALYNYAAARTRGGQIPFASRIDLLERFLQEFPNSPQAPKVHEYLASAYFQERDYASALSSIDRIANPSQAVKSARQKILYELGMQQLQNGQAREAASSLSDATSMGNLNRDLLPEAYLWQGDAYYATSRWKDAERAYRKSISSGVSGSNKALALYGLGYSLYNQGLYGDAADYLRKASGDRLLPQRMRRDAELRLADCLYYSGDNSAARKIYEKSARAEREGGSDDESDYAAWRHAELTGLEGNLKGKVEELETLARTASGRWQPEILASLADAYSRTGNSKGAEETYRKIISSWPSSKQAETADSELRRIYTASGQLPEYAEFLESIPGAMRIDASEMEALLFDSALDAFNDDECNIKRAEDYLKRYPTGAHSTEVLYMVARGREANGNSKGALLAYRLLEESGDREYAHVAAAGIMNNSDDPSERIAYARRVAGMPGVSAEDLANARFIEAEALADSGKDKEALAIWSELSHNPLTLSGSKSAVCLAEYYVKSKQYGKAEKLLTDFVDSGTPHSYWLARGYIALADVYAANGKKYLARQYLESLRDNYPGNESDIADMVARRLARL